MDSLGLGSGALQDVADLAGGTQNILLRFRRGDSGYVLRRPPRHPRANANETMRREARVLAALAATDVPHARLIAACSDENVLGAAFYLMEPVDGFNPTNGLPPLHANSAVLRQRHGGGHTRRGAARIEADPCRATSNRTVPARGAPFWPPLHRHRRNRRWT